MLSAPITSYRKTGIQLSSEWLTKPEFSKWTQENSIPSSYCIVDAVPTLVRVLAGDITLWTDWLKVSKMMETTVKDFDIEKKEVPDFRGYVEVTDDAMKQVCV
jgi:hypothetical protein